MSSTGDDASTAPRELTAAEKRAARRSKVLAGGERRMKLVTGEIDSLKSDDPVEQAMNDGVMELLADATELIAESEKVMEKSSNDEAEEPEYKPIKIPTRIDPAQRRRDAQARRQKKEAMVEQILSGAAPTIEPVAEQAQHENTSVSAETVYAESVATVRKELSVEKKVEPAFSRHSLALRLQTAQDKLIVVAILGAAIYLAVTTDLRNVTTDIITSNQLFVSYQQLFQKGVPVESIRQQMQHANLQPSFVTQMERYFTSQRKGENVSPSASSSSYFPSVFDVSEFFKSLTFHPPIVIVVILLRFIVELVGVTAHRVLKLPDVKNPQEDDLGFVLNLALSSRPAVKSFIGKTRKYVDDLLFFIWTFVVAVAVRAIWEHRE